MRFERLANEPIHSPVKSFAGLLNQDGMKGKEKEGQGSRARLAAFLQILPAEK